MSKLTPRQLKAVSMLAQGKTHTQVALELGITTKTVQRWINRTDFAQAVADVQREATRRTVERTAEEISRHSQEVITRLVPKALTVIHEYLNDPSAKGSDRLRAVHIIGSWAGLNQSQVKPEPQVKAEENLKDYLEFISGRNGNGHGNVGG